MTALRSTAKNWKTGIRESWRTARRLWQLPTDDDLY